VPQRRQRLNEVGPFVEEKVNMKIFLAIFLTSEQNKDVAD